MTPEIESVFAHLLDPRCRLRAADRRGATNVKAAI